jgi:hypothetical protein
MGTWNEGKIWVQLVVLIYWQPAVVDQYYQRFDDQDPRQLDATQTTLNSTLSALRVRHSFPCDVVY